MQTLFPGTSVCLLQKATVKPLSFWEKESGFTPKEKMQADRKYNANGVCMGWDCSGQPARFFCDYTFLSAQRAIANEQKEKGKLNLSREKHSTLYMAPSI